MVATGSVSASKRPLRLEREHVVRFAEATGDRNGLHMDESVGRKTPFGRCIAHGALVTTAALGLVNAETLAHLSALDVQFKQPVFPGDDYAMAAGTTRDGRPSVEISGAGRVALTVTLTPDPEGREPREAPEQASLPLMLSPRPHTVEELVDGRCSYEEPYACRLDLLSRLATDLDADHVPARVLVWLAAASYTVGMLLPGEDALFAGARITRTSASRSGWLRASTSAVDDRTGLLVVDATLDAGEASAQMTLNTFVRPKVPPPTRATVARYLPPSDGLAGRKILVVGGSRGLGAALCGTFATQGANVWAGFARSRDDAEAVRDEFGPARVDLLQFDAQDPDEARRAFEALRERAPVLDGVVLSAAPPLLEATLDPASTHATLRFLDASLAMALVPLAESLQLLAPTGWVVFMSSAALDDPPELWPHYVAAKAALEGAAAYCVSRRSVRVFVVRAPRTWTESTNTPLGRIGAAPKEQVAAAIVSRILQGEQTTNPVVLRPDELLVPQRGA